MGYNLLKLLSVVCFLGFCWSAAGDDDTSNEVENELIPIKYNKNVRPSFGEGPVNVTFNMYIRHMHLDLQKSEVILSMIFRRFWRDERLEFSPDQDDVTLYDISNVWKPDIFFSGALEVNQPDERNFLFRVAADGSVLWSENLEVHIVCPLDMSDYPYDNQTCEFGIGSFAHRTEDIYVEAKPLAVNQQLAKFEYFIESMTTSKDTVSLSTGDYDEVMVILNIGHHKGSSNSGRGH